MLQSLQFSAQVLQGVAEKPLQAVLIDQMLPPFENYKQVFLETTKSEHNHGGAGWEFGTCLWSPTRNARKARSYEIMKQPQPGDLVLHNYHYSPDDKRAHSYLCGYSVVMDAVETVGTEPPSPGDWGGRSEYYRIELQDFEKIDPLLDFRTFTATYGEDVRSEIANSHPGFYPLTISRGIVRPNQGMYLTKVTENLYSVFCEALGIESVPLEPKEKKKNHQAYAEGGRRRREANHFIRNAALAKEAKEHFGYTCQMCGFSPLNLYGKRNAATGLDCHHLDPLAERLDFDRESTLEDVTVLCANCHRLVHCRRPALSIEKAKTLFRIKPFTLGEDL